MQTYDKNFIWERIIITENDCWEWQGSKDQRGYGLVNRNCGESRAHRLSYREFKGEIPFGMVVRHKCDYPPCCNPEHLIVGTMGDNMQDCVERGRHRYVIPPSPNRASQQLVENVLALHKQGVHKVTIANETDIALSTVYNIINRTKETNHE